MTAAREGDITELEAAIHENKIDYHATGRALREVAASGQYEAIELLLKADTSINTLGGLHGTPLNAASFSGYYSIVKVLLEHNSDVNIEGGIFKNAILAAAINQHTEVVMLLLQYPHISPIKPNILNSSLRVAISTAQIDIVTQLLKAGADPNTQDILLGTPLQQASFFQPDGNNETPPLRVSTASRANQSPKRDLQHSPRSSHKNRKHTRHPAPAPTQR